jgi:GNAT superfamily N-acetyltransferase
MKFIRLTRPAGNYFEKAWALYKASFPPEERRGPAGQERVIENQEYHFEVVTEGEDFIGIILWWGFDELYYLEHLAIRTELQGKGYGTMILKKFISSAKRQILLDVELPAGTLEKRRISFYEQLGFVLNVHEYFQPPMQEGHGPVRLLLMSYPVPVTKYVLEHFIRDCHPVIYG